jgi:hypothetical protein
MSHPSINPLTPMANRVRGMVQPGRSRELGQTQENMRHRLQQCRSNLPDEAHH